MIKKRKILKNGRSAGYVLQKNGKWKWSFLKDNKTKQKGGNNVVSTCDTKKILNELEKKKEEMSKKVIEKLNQKKKRICHRNC